jgi:hypothetical protein
VCNFVAKCCYLRIKFLSDENRCRYNYRLNTSRYPLHIKQLCPLEFIFIPYIGISSTKAFRICVGESGTLSPLRISWPLTFRRPQADSAVDFILSAAAVRARARDGRNAIEITTTFSTRLDIYNAIDMATLYTLQNRLLVVLYHKVVRTSALS